jgi:hypothetical protein
MNIAMDNSQWNQANNFAMDEEYEQAFEYALSDVDDDGKFIFFLSQCFKS